MNCEQTRENLAAFIDGELDEGALAGIQEHIESCEGCRQELEAFRQTARALEEFLEPRAMREGVAEGVLSALASERGKRRVPLVTRLGWALTGAAAAVLILAVFGFMGMEGGGEVVFADEVVDEAVVTFGKTGGSCDEFLGNQTLTVVGAGFADEALVIQPVPNATTVAALILDAGESFGVEISTAETTGAATCTMDVFGYEYYA